MEALTSPPADAAAALRLEVGTKAASAAGDAAAAALLAASTAPEVEERGAAEE